MVKFVCPNIFNQGGVLIIDDLLIDVLNIEKTYVNDLFYQACNGEAHIFVSFKKKTQKCPHCHLETNKTNGTKTKCVNHGLYLNKKCILHLKLFRYYCFRCQKTFLFHPPIAAPYKHTSLATMQAIMNLLSNPHMTFKSVGEQLNISDKTVQRLFKEAIYIPQSTSLPSVLCIDEVYLGKSINRKYAAVLLDFETNQVIDFFFGRTVNDLLRNFQSYSKENRSRVQYISTDMYKGYLHIAQTLFPQAKVCIDSFHIIQLILAEFDSYLRSVMKQCERDSINYYLLKKQRSLILKNENRINWYESHYHHKLGYTAYNYKLRELIFAIDPKIEDYYRLKEDYIVFNRSTELQSIERKLDTIINRFMISDDSGFKKVGRTLIQYKKEILNSFTRVKGRRISNGPIESRNNIIKLIMRNAAGYRNFDNLRTRVIYVCNHHKSGKK